ncbi:MAG: anaerobic ribonucleoside-triphosphate reductase activating protein [Desulfobacteraceae bacterium]|nr:anaerobic ribonucleoside-triphosphate reductase activating protein [Desulfobacteraceae bacterium]
MHIGGLQKYSLIDYPGLVSSVVFTAGCNFHCPYCHNPELASPGKNTAKLQCEEVCAFLSKRKNFLDGVVISGGEPTLQPELAEFCKKIKSLGLCLKIDTNGSRPDVIKKIIDRGLADYIAMDIKTDPEAYAPQITDKAIAPAIRETADIILSSGLSHEFRTTCVKPFTCGATIKVIAELIRGADLHAIQHPRTDSVLSCEFFEQEQRFHTEEELRGFRSILAKTVKQAIIR